MSSLSYSIPGLVLTDHSLAVPLDWSKPEGETITLFAREVVDPMRKHDDLPCLLFLQGGPGGKSNRPQDGTPPWLDVALKQFRVILMDQRGTGRSSPVEGRHMAAFATAEKGADFLSCFRADSIIRDAEHLRKTLFGGRKWSTLGQSYGGFLTLSYLSFAPEALEACYVTGGLPGLTASADDVYARTFPRVKAKTETFYARYPQDVETVARIADLLTQEDVRLPDGDRLSVERFQTLGMDFGMAPCFENLHWLLDEAFAADGVLSDTFLFEVMTRTGFATNPLFAALQETIYAQSGNVSAWAAQRAREVHPEFAPDQRPLMFTGEMMFPWMFEDIRTLRPFAAATDALARRRFDAPFYDLARLRDNQVPVAAVVYYDDMYVDAGLSLDTAGRVGNLRAWVTNEYEHDGLRRDPRVLQRLFDMVQRGLQ
ncbi:proline iminopeptidase [Celeribacter ethanolicus]|uniref:Proline iminopeptidase n=1 Tax=Celeribacter ethanolicus TaxID=1758178 RepID=A0A291G7D5_9RHOB|nr:alpha/beta fold hydrolase [Celeribacter ethanolicus]ATG46169.1 proline iminopeptidase [Celeribacter ethanolicus]